MDGHGQRPRRRLAGLAVATFEHAFGRRSIPFRVHIQQVDEKIVTQRFRSLCEHTVPGLPHVGIQRAQATDQHRHLRGAQVHQLRPVHQHLGNMAFKSRTNVIAESVGLGGQRLRGT